MIHFSVNLQTKSERKKELTDLWEILFLKGKVYFQDIKVFMFNYYISQAGRILELCTYMTD